MAQLATHTPISVAWQNLNFKVITKGCGKIRPSKTLHILKDLNGCVLPGKMLVRCFSWLVVLFSQLLLKAIIGGSGAGKSTLLDILVRVFGLGWKKAAISLSKSGESQELRGGFWATSFQRRKSGRVSKSVATCRFVRHTRGHFEGDVDGARNSHVSGRAQTGSKRYFLFVERFLSNVFFGTKSL